MRTNRIFCVLAGLLLCPLAALAQERDASSELIRHWYQKYLQREPQPTEVQTWANAIRQGTPTREAQAVFLGSQEYFEKAGSTSEGFVRKLHEDVAGHAPRPEVVRAWVLEAQNRNRVEVAKLFLAQVAANAQAAPPAPKPPVAAPPNVDNDREERLVRHWYHHYLEERPDAKALRHWVHELNRAAVAEDVLAHFLASPEYYAKAGGTPERFVQKVYRDVAGHEPGRQAHDFWVNHAGDRAERERMASWILKQFPGHADERKPRGPE